MANLKDLIVNGAARIIGKTYSSEFVGNVTGNVTGNVAGNLTGNVTGNVSGSSGSCIGNATTSSKLKTAVSLTTTDGTNTSEGIDFDGSAPVSIKLPATITATFSGNLTGDVTGSVSGNAGTATKLKTARSLKITDDGTNTSTGVDFDGSDAVTLRLPSTIKASITGNVSGSSGSCTGNAKTATTADKTAYSLSIADGASTPVAAIDGWNGSANKTLTIKGDSPVTTAASTGTGTITIAHATSGVTAGTYKSVTVDAKGHVTDGANPTTLDGYGITDAKIEDGIITLGSNTITPLTAESTLVASKVSGTLATSNIPNLDASKITTGTISIDRLPATALERCVVVVDDDSRFALTEGDVQVGDTIKVTSTKKMYMVVNSSKLDDETGYEEYFTSTDWSTVTNKPDSFTPTGHPHGNITNSGAIGNTPDKLIATTTDGVLTAATTLAATPLAAGSAPTVSLTDGTLTFGIPKGDKGDTGPEGPNFTLAAGSGHQYLIGAPSQTENINTAGTSGAYYEGSNLYASGFYVSSLRSLKENIEPTKVNATELINSQEVVDFNYKDDEHKSHKVGLIADDSDPLFLDKKGETVDLYNTCGILMKAVQELSKRIEELEQKLNQKGTSLPN